MRKIENHEEYKKLLEERSLELQKKKADRDQEKIKALHEQINAMKGSK
ncbi:MAG: hypothetical protein NW226_06910 [Microscillaceae bacterium]|nr:hypothetical protein [Microscillaceae bacterium]